MDDSDIWSVDRLAASNLLAHLRIEAGPDSLDIVERHFARHRRTSMEWAAERMRLRIIDQFETASQEYFPRHGDEWNQGFRAAEAELMVANPKDLLQLETGKAQSRGQILRSLVRHARKS